MTARPPKRVLLLARRERLAKELREVRSLLGELAAPPVDWPDEYRRFGEELWYHSSVEELVAQLEFYSLWHGS